MGKNKGMSVKVVPSRLLLLEYNSIDDNNSMNRSFFQNLFSHFNVQQICICNSTSLYVLCQDVHSGKELYRSCKSQLIQRSENNRFIPQFIPFVEKSQITSVSQDENKIEYGIQSINEEIMEMIIPLFEKLQQLYSFQEEKDTIITNNPNLIKSFHLMNSNDSQSWRNTQQHYTWNEMTKEVTNLLEIIQTQYSIPFHIDSLVIKKASPSLSIPLHLDHHLFSSTFIAIPIFPLISSLLLYNHTQQVVFTKPVQLSPPCRYTDFITLRLLTQQPAFLLLLTQASNNYSCSCQSEYCMNTILQQPLIHQQYQTDYVDRAYPLLSSYFQTSTTKFFKPVLSFISSFQPSSILLDTGCGDCKYLHHTQSQSSSPIFILGQDCCKEMLLLDKYSSHTKYHLIQSDICQLSMREKSVDGVICVSVIQHLPNKYKQLKALQNLISICKPGGRILIYVWSFENKAMKPRFADCRSDYFLPWKVNVDTLKEMNISFKYSLLLGIFIIT